MSRDSLYLKGNRMGFVIPTPLLFINRLMSDSIESLNPHKFVFTSMKKINIIDLNYSRVYEPGLFTSRGYWRCKAQGLKSWSFTANAL